MKVNPNTAAETEGAERHLANACVC